MAESNNYILVNIRVDREHDGNRKVHKNGNGLAGLKVCA